MPVDFDAFQTIATREIAELQAFRKRAEPMLAEYETYKRDREAAERAPAPVPEPVTVEPVAAAAPEQPPAAPPVEPSAE